LVGKVASYIIAPGGRGSLVAAERIASMGDRYKVDFLSSVGGALSKHLRPLHASGDSLRDMFKRNSSSSRESIEELFLQSPDGITIQGWLVGWPQGSAPPPRGVIVYFGGNAEICELRGDLLKTWRERGFGVLLFNYRNFGASEGSISRDGLVLDALTVISFLTEGRGLVPHRTILFGHSLGGALSTEAATLISKQGVIVINDRSFGLLSDVGAFMLLPPGLLPGGWGKAEGAGGPGRPLGLGGAASGGTAMGSPEGELSGWLARAAFRIFMRHVACWEYDTLHHWKSLPSNTKIILYDPADSIIPLPTALVSTLTHPGAALAPGVVGSIGRLDTGTKLSTVAHNRPLERAENDRLDSVLKLACGVLTGGVTLRTGERNAGVERVPLPKTF